MTNSPGLLWKDPYECTYCVRDGHTKDHCWGRDINGKRPPAPPGYRFEHIKEKAFQVNHNEMKNCSTDNSLSDQEHVFLTSRIFNSIQTVYILGLTTQLAPCTSHLTY